MSYATEIGHTMRPRLLGYKTTIWYVCVFFFVFADDPEMHPHWTLELVGFTSTADVTAVLHKHHNRLN